MFVPFLLYLGRRKKRATSPGERLRVIALNPLVKGTDDRLGEGEGEPVGSVGGMAVAQAG